jgi:hypothetical protein
MRTFVANAIDHELVKFIAVVDKSFAAHQEMAECLEEGARVVSEECRNSISPLLNGLDIWAHYL